MAAAVLAARVEELEVSSSPRTPGTGGEVGLSEAQVSLIVRSVASEGFAVVDGALGDAHASALRVECLGVEKASSTIAEGTSMNVDASRRDDVIAWLKKSDTPAVAAHRRAMDDLRTRLEAVLALKMDSSSSGPRLRVLSCDFSTWESFEPDHMCVSRTPHPPFERP